MINAYSNDNFQQQSFTHEFAAFPATLIPGASYTSEVISARSFKNFTITIVVNDSTQVLGSEIYISNYAHGDQSRIAWSKKLATITTASFDSMYGVTPYFQISISFGGNSNLLPGLLFENIDVTIKNVAGNVYIINDVSLFMTK
jgi:hypothetical protein